MNYKLIDLKTFGDERGKLASFQDGVNCPFEVKRAFYIFDTKGDISRGCHANRNSEFLLVLINGSCRVKIDDGHEVSDVLLNNPHKALYLNKMVWKEMYEFSYNAVLLVLTNTIYDEKEYIRNYDEFLKEINKVDFLEYDEKFLEKSWEWLNNPEIKDLTDTPNFTKESQRIWYESLKDKKDYFVKGVALNSLPIGVVGLKKITSDDAEFFAYIGEKSFWGKKIGSQMLEYAINIAKEKSLSKVYLTVKKDNFRAQKLYEKFNFKINEQKSTDDLYYMELAI